MTGHEESTLTDALAAIGEDEELRVRFIALLRHAEVRLARLDFDVREQVTGPIVDALHRRIGQLHKQLASGVDFHFHYRSKIAREFVLAPDSQPDHVWEPQTTRLLLELSRRARHVVVGGAYSGDQAVLLARQIRGEGGIVHCFEPNDDQLAMLKHNAAVNGLDNLKFNRLGLWDRDRAHLHLVGDDSFAHPEPAEAGSDGSFATVTIDSYGRAERIEHLDLIMLDIEGAELAALRGAERYLGQATDRAPHLVFEVHRHYVDWSRGLDNTEICQYLSGFGYHLFAVRDYQSNVPMGHQPIELIRPDETYLEGPPHGFNMLAVKDPAVLANPTFRFVSGVSPKLLKHRDPKLHQPLAGAA
jgi:FkbM family methyltransferase